jgi:predicted HD phosphohydrolase
MRSLLRQRQLARSEQRALADKVAMTIARLKEHIAAHRYGTIGPKGFDATSALSQRSDRLGFGKTKFPISSIEVRNV